MGDCKNKMVCARKRLFQLTFNPIGRDSGSLKTGSWAVVDGKETPATCYILL